MSLYIGIDSGTQGTKAVVVDMDARRVVAQARAGHRMLAGLPIGSQEQDPREWTAALDGALRGALAQVERGRVRGIGVSGQQHGFVPLDAAGEVIRPAKLWCDTSTSAECAILTRRLGGERAVLRKTGVLFLPGYTAPKILWLKRREPGNYRRLRHVLLPHDYLNFHLTGNYFMEFGDASGTALMDVRRRAWSPAAISAIDRNLADWLPPLSASHEIAGVLRPALSRKYGLPRDVRVSAGGGDNMMGAIGTGNVVPGVVTASFGTSGTLYAHASKPVVDPRGEIAAFCSSAGGWLPLVCTMNATAVTDRMRDLFGWDHAGLELAVRSAAPGAGGLLLLPYLVGERTPNVPDGTGVLFGLNDRTLDRAALARASVEGVTLGMNFGLKRLASLGVKAREIRVTGGGSKSAAWRQIMADVFGLPVVAMAAEEGAALGGAIQAAWACARCDGGRAEIREFATGLVAVDEASRCEPDRVRAGRYRELQALQDRLSVILRPLFRARRGLSD
jgi:xylulokinase